MDPQVKSDPAQVAKSCPTNWHVEQDARDGTYHCVPANTEAAVGQALALPIVIVAAVLIQRARKPKQ